MVNPVSLDFSCLGNHVNYIGYIALPNYRDYYKAREQYEKESSNIDEVNLFRYFVNAAESMNNIIDYFYYDHEEDIRERGFNLQTLRSGIHNNHKDLSLISDFANAYKHSVRENRGKKKKNLPWAKDLHYQKASTKITISQNGSIKSNSEFSRELPPIYDDALVQVFIFWMEYFNEDMNVRFEKLINEVK